MTPINFPGQDPTNPIKPKRVKGPEPTPAAPAAPKQKAAPKAPKDEKNLKSKGATGPINDSIDLSKVSMPGLEVQKALGLSRPVSSAGLRKVAETLADATEGARPIQSPIA